jgi:hypothetical protein
MVLAKEVQRLRGELTKSNQVCEVVCGLGLYVCLVMWKCLGNNCTGSVGKEVSEMRVAA